MKKKRNDFPMRYPERDDVIVPQYAIQVCVLVSWGRMSAEQL